MSDTDINGNPVPKEDLKNDYIDNLKPLCIQKKCGLNITCELATARPGDRSRQVQDLFVQGGKPGDRSKPGECDNWELRQELGSDGSPPKGGATINRPGRRGNGQRRFLTRRPGFDISDPRHADLSVAGLGKDVDLTRPLHTQLPSPPDLQVSRHIKDGRDIKKDNN